MPIRELFRESWESLYRGGRATVLSFLIVGLLLAGSAVVEMAVFRDLAQIQHARRLAGTEVIVAAADGSSAFTVADCLSLGHLAGVERRGAVVAHGSASIGNLGGANIVAVDVAGDLVGIWASMSAAPAAGLVLGADIAAELGIAPGSLLDAELGSLGRASVTGPTRYATPADVLAGTPREPNARGWLLVQRLAPSEASAECWVEAAPGATASLRDVVGALLAVDGRAPVVRDLVSSSEGVSLDLAERFSRRPSRWAFAAAAGMGLLFELLMSLVRRRRWALYLAVGLRRTDLCLIAAGRTLILLSVAWLGSLAVAAVYATGGLADGITREIVRAGFIQAVLFSAVTLLLTPLTLAVLAGMSMVESLRE